MKDKLTVLQINKFYYLKGGSERYLFDLSKILEAAGLTVAPFAMQDERNRPSTYADYFSQFMDLHRFSLKNIFKIFYNYEAARRLEELIDKVKPDLAHLHNINYQLSPSIIRVLKKHHLPIVMTLHDYNIICPNAKLFTKGAHCERCRGGRYYHCFLNKCSHNSLAQSFLAMLEAYFNQSWLKVYSQVDLFIAPSQAIKQAFIRFGWPEEKIINLSYPMDAASGQAEKIDSTNYILYFGRLAPEKGIDTLLDAMVKVDGRINLKIAGAGPDYEKLNKRIKDLDLTARAELLGAKYDNELSNLIKAASAIVIPSLWQENMPLAMLESLALGKIVIASQRGGLGEMIKDGVNGFLFKSGDSDELAQKINLAASRNEAVINMEQRIKNSLDGINSKKHQEEMLNLYKKILGSENF